MQTNVLFYVLPDDSDESTITQLACVQAAKSYRENQRVFIFTQDQPKAHDIDELLWSFEADSFVPHNLVGEGPKNGAPVEISWQPPTSRRQVLINLTETVPNFAHLFSQIIDFVPAQAELKQKARERYKVFKQAGVPLETKQINTATDKQEQTTS